MMTLRRAARLVAARAARLVATDREPLVATHREPLVAADREPLVATDRAPLVATHREPLVATDRARLVAADRQPLVATDRARLVAARRAVLVAAAGALVAGALVVAGCGDDTTSGSGLDLAAVGDMAVPDLATGATAARGEELVKHLLLCGSCHTTPDATGAPSTSPSDFLAGGRKFTLTLPGDGGSVDVYAPNLTPDNATGLGTWTNGQISDAVTVGVDAMGLPLWPTMPYQRFANLTPDDAASIALYLKSLPAQSHTVPDDSAHPALAATAFSYATIPHTTLPSTDPSFAAAERGRYLANLGCLTCHTVAAGPPAGVDVAKAYAGGRSFPGGVKSSNLTPDPTGLAGWTTADIISTLKTNLEKGTGRMLNPSMPGGTAALGGLFDNDLSDLATYIHTLPPVTNGPFGPGDM